VKNRRDIVVPSNYQKNNRFPARRGFGVPKTSGAQPPIDAIVAYNFEQFYPADAIKELVNGQVSVMNSTGSNVNILQDYSNGIETFLPGQSAFNRGVGLVEQDVAVNYVRDSLTATVASWTKRGTATAMQSSVVAPDADYFMDEISVTDDSGGDMFTSVNGLPFSVPIVAMSFYMKRLDSGQVRIQNPTGGSGHWVIDTDLLGGGVERITRDHAAVTVNQEFVSSATGATGFLFRNHVAGAPIKFYAWQYQQTGDLNGNVTSDIYTNGGPSQRDPSNDQLSTFLKADRWIAEGVVLGNYYIDGVYLHGVQQGVSEGNQVNVLFATTEGVSGTFQGLCVAAWLGAVFVVGNYRLPVHIVGNTSRVSIDLAGTGLDSAELTALIGNDGTSSNPFTIKFMQSDYLTNGSIDLAADTLVIDQLMLDASIPNTGLPAAAMWPVNDFTVKLDFVIKSLSEDVMGWVSIGESRLDASNTFSLLQNGTTGETFIFQTRIGGVVDGTTVALATRPDIGDVMQIVLTKHSANGMTLDLNNITKAETATGTDATGTLDVVWNSEYDVSNSTFYKRINTLFKSLTVTPL